MERKVMNTCLAAIVVLGLVQGASARTATIAGQDRTDFALFDGADPTTLETGVACGAQQGGGAPIPFTYFVTVSNWSSSVQVIRVRYNDNVTIARYQIPAGSSYSFTQTAGSKAGLDDVIRVVAETAPPSGLAGSVSFLSGAAAHPHPELGGDSYCVTLTINP